jgi:hypothetical protein
MAQYLCKFTSGKPLVVDADHDPVSHLVHHPALGQKVVVVSSEPFDPKKHSKRDGTHPLIVVTPSEIPEPAAEVEAPAK